MVREKNADEVFQNAVWQSTSVDPRRAKQSGVAPISKDDAKSDADQGESTSVRMDESRMLTPQQLPSTCECCSPSLLLTPRHESS